MIRILGIDPGTAIVGWGIIDCDYSSTVNKVIAYGHIETDKSLSTAKRLQEVDNSILFLIKKYKPQEAAVEELFYFKNAKTVISVAHFFGPRHRRRFNYFYYREIAGDFFKDS